MNIKMKKIMLSFMLMLSGCSQNSTMIEKEEEAVEKTDLVGERAEQTYWTEHRIDVGILCQFPEYPTGCEAVSAVMLLQYLGEDITVGKFIDQYLEMGTLTYDENGELYGPSPYDCFIGDPRSEESYGCYATVIEEALYKFYGMEGIVEATTGMSLEELCMNYIQQDIPVLIWASIAMEELFSSTVWETPKGEMFEWLGNEHCLLLVGYDKTYYYFNDPWFGEVRAYEKEIVESRYEMLGRQSLTIKKA